MRVLITRTAEDSRATAKALEALGHQAVIAPLRARVALENPIPEGPFEAVIATSRHAFAGLPARIKTLPCFCVGEKTAEAARAAGFTHAEAHGGDGAALAAGLLARFKPGAHLLYLAGQPRHPALENALAAGGLALAIVERYAMQPVETLPEAARAALEAGTIDAVLHYSAQSARAYLDLATRANLLCAALQPVQICLSSAVAAVLVAADPLVSLKIALAPNEAALLLALAE